jgi:proteasome accessory factor A
MPIAKVLGIETEYGVAGGPDGDPITASTLVVNAYAQQSRTRVNWDFVDESPGRDARGRMGEGQLAPPIETHLANTVLTNGARLYVDHAHPEYSSPEVRTPREAVLYDLAGEQVMVRAMRAVNETLPSEMAVTLYKNNSDGKGNSYGTHENYLIERQLPFTSVVRAMVPHFISRAIICGAGKVGAETDEARGYGVPFQISARAEFFEEVVGLETTLKRPIINTRDEPHSDPERFRRLHVINGDANMSQVATLVKVGSTSLLLAALEFYGPEIFPPVPQRPVSSFHAFARDLSLTATTATDVGSWSAANYQERLLEIAVRFSQEGDASVVAPPDQVEEILREWQILLEGVVHHRDAVCDRVDWLAKLRIVEGFRERHQTTQLDARLRAIDLQYHDIRPEKSLAQRVGLKAIFSADEASLAVSTPPATTRAYFRGTCVARFPDELVSANWDSLIFDVGKGPLRRVSMMDPLKGTADLTQGLFSSVDSVEHLVQLLSD